MIASIIRAVGYWMIAAGLVGLVLGPLLRRHDRASFADTIAQRWDLELPVHSRRLPHDWQERGEL